MNFAFVGPWHLFLPQDGGHVVAVAGSGGKTTLLRVFAATYGELGVPTILTTTTRTEPLAEFTPVLWADLVEDPDLVPADAFVHAGIADDGKWLGVEPEQADRLGELLPGRVVLAEVDGAAKHPVKLYRNGEPVWPRRTSLAVVVMGTAAIGAQAGRVVHRLGRITDGPLSSLSSDEIFTWDHLRDLLLDVGGYLAQVPEQVPTILALTGMDDLTDSIGLFEFVGHAMDHERLPLTLFLGLGEMGPDLRTACRNDADGTGPDA